MRTGIILVLFGLLLSVVAEAAKKKPAVVILCERGGVVNHGALLANAGQCVGHDKYGGAFSAAAVAVFREGVEP